MPKGDTLVAIDVGTSKISCLIGNPVEDGHIEILGKGYVPSHGIKKGAIDDIGECAKSIELAVIEAENSAGVRVSHALAGISGEYITACSSRGKVKVSSKSKEITKQDVDSVIEAARHEKAEANVKILHVIPRGYSVDGYGGVKNPVGMIGKKLEVNAYLVAGAQKYIQNITKAFNQSGLEMDDTAYVYSSLAAAKAVVEEAEKNLGVVVIDMGAGTTKVNVFKGGMLIHSRTYPLGGDNLTYDIAMFYKIPLSEAESLKVYDGSACPDLLTEQEEEEEVEAASFSESQSIVLIQRKVLSEIIEARLMDIFESINRDMLRLKNKGIYIAGAVLTGGGARLKHINFLAQKILEVPAKIGRPLNIQGLGDWEGNPEFASVVGALKMASEKKSQGATPVFSGEFAGMFKKVVGWLQEIF